MSEQWKKDAMFLLFLEVFLDGLSDGCHHLIQEGAKLVTSGQDVLAEFEF